MFRAPSQSGLPPLSLMLGDISTTTAKIARHLDISERTLQRYIAAEQAPRVVQLALFWETRWGRSYADCDAINDARIHYMKAMSLEHQNILLSNQVLRLERELALAYEGGHGAANSPVWRVM